MNLAGLIVITDSPRRLLGVAKREVRRVGWLGFLDAAAFRLFSRIWLRKRDEAWKKEELARLRLRYPANLSCVPRMFVADPNAEEAREFLQKNAPDLIVARCKFILRPEIFQLARIGSFALHPGICPEYRNAHGCFWALVNRDTNRVGMTLLKIDRGVDTGPVYLHASCPIDEVRESHTVIQYRVVLENLEAIGRTLIAICEGRNPATIPTAGRKSAVWGQPRLTSYLRWKKSARQNNASRIPAVS